VWPGYTVCFQFFLHTRHSLTIILKVFPDWFAPNAQQYWTEALTNWSESGVTFSGIWLDMNEASSFCDGWVGFSLNVGSHVLKMIIHVGPVELESILATQAYHSSSLVYLVIPFQTIQKGICFLCFQSYCPIDTPSPDMTPPFPVPVVTSPSTALLPSALATQAPSSLVPFLLRSTLHLSQLV